MTALLPENVIAATLKGADWSAWAAAARTQAGLDGLPLPGPWEAPAAQYLLLAWPYIAYREPVPVSGYYPASNRAYHATKQLAARLGGRPHPDIPLKACAQMAGLANYGDNGVALVAGCGSRAVLTAIAFDEGGFPDVTPPPPPQCLHCGKCLSACPTQAVAGGRVDRQRCLSAATLRGGIQLRLMRHRLDGRLHGCDACQAVCPLNPPPQEAPPQFLQLFAPENLLMHWDKRAVADCIGANLAKARLLGGLAALALPREAAFSALSHPWPEVRAHAAASLIRGGEEAAVRQHMADEKDPAVLAVMEEESQCPSCTEKP